eukprot:scaffold36596_cov52-Phaeocystis_antarctica.AAC.2
MPLAHCRLLLVRPARGERGNAAPPDAARLLAREVGALGHVVVVVPLAHLEVHRWPAKVDLPRRNEGGDAAAHSAHRRCEQVEATVPPLPEAAAAEAAVLAPRRARADGP